MPRAAAATLAFCTLRLRLGRAEWILNFFLGIALPLLLQASFGEHLAAPARLRLMIGVLIFAGLLLAFRRTTLVLTTEQARGQTMLLAHAGLSKASYLTGHAVDALARSALPLLFVALSVQLFALPDARTYGWVVPYLAIVILGFAAGLLLATLELQLAAVALVSNLVVVGAFVFCPIAYGADRVPGPLAVVASVLPPTVASDLIWSSWSTGTQALTPLALLSTGALALLAWASRRLSWPR